MAVNGQKGLNMLRAIYQCHTWSQARSTCFAVRYKSTRPQAKYKSKTYLNAQAAKRWNAENKAIFGPQKKKKLANLKEQSNKKEYTEEIVTSELVEECDLKAVDQYFADHQDGDESVVPKVTDIDTNYELTSKSDIPQNDSSSSDNSQEEHSELESNTNNLNSMLLYPLLKTVTQPHIGTLNANSGVSEVSAFRAELGGRYASAYPGVTTVLGKSRPPESQFYLDRWKNQMTEQLGEEGFKKHMTGKLIIYNLYVLHPVNLCHICSVNTSHY